MIIISDNGCGCESIKEGFGLKHIRERVELLNGEVNYQGMIGFTIIAKIPIRNKLTGKKDRDELNNLADNNDKAKDSQWKLERGHFEIYQENVGKIKIELKWDIIKYIENNKYNKNKRNRQWSKY